MQDLWGEMYCIDQGKSLYSTKDEYLIRYFRKISDHEWTLIHGAEPLIYKQLHGVAKTWDHDLDALPNLTLNEVGIPLPESARAWYNELRDEGTLEDLDFISANAGVVHQKKRQLAAGAIYDPDGHCHAVHKGKVTRFKEIVEELQGSPALVVYEFNHDLDAIRGATKGLRVGCINGQTSTRESAETIKAWRAGELHILAVHPLSAGYGLNLQAAGQDIIFYTMPQSLELIEQCIGRLWRTGQKNAVTTHFLLVKGTVDRDVFRNFKKKAATQDGLFEALAQRPMPNS